MTTHLLLILSALLLIGCTPTRPNPERPATLARTWTRADTLGQGTRDTSVELDSLVLRADGSAARVRRRRFVGSPFDSAFTYTAWRVATDSTTHAATLCLEAAAIGTPTCLPVVTQGGDSLVVRRLQGQGAYTRLEAITLRAQP